jgi:hypothetical protein
MKMSIAVQTDRANQTRGTPEAACTRKNAAPDYPDTCRAKPAFTSTYGVPASRSHLWILAGMIVGSLLIEVLYRRFIRGNARTAS